MRYDYNGYHPADDWHYHRYVPYVPCVKSPDFKLLDPAVKFVEVDGAFVCELDTPGFSKSDLKIEIAHDDISSQNIISVVGTVEVNGKKRTLNVHSVVPKHADLSA